MEAAALGRGGRSARSVASRVARARSRAFWIVAGLTLLAALRASHARRPVLPPRRDRHRQPHPPRRLRPRDERGRVQRVDAAALLRPRLALDAAGRHRRIRAALALRRWPGWRRSRSPTWSGWSCAAAAPASWRRRWSRSTRCCSGTRRRRAPTRCFALLCAVSLLYCVRGAAARRPPRLRPLGIASALALATHYFAVFPLAAEAIWLLAGAAARACGASGSSPRRAAAGAARDPPDVAATPNGSAATPRPPPLGTGATFLTGETGDIIARPERPAAGLVPFACSSSPPSPARSPRRRATSAAPPRVPLRVAGAPSGSRCCWRSPRPARTTCSPAT